MKYKMILLYGIFLIAHTVFAQNDSTIYHIELDGLLAVEAEYYHNQSKINTRQWYELSENSGLTPTPDHDVNHYRNASNGKYMEILPDTRVTHDDPLNSTNFSGEPGYHAIISYQVYFNTPGKYYVWARCFSTGTEDNGVHVGINGSWPSSGKRIQWCDGKNKWTWSNKQRTSSNHCGVPYQIYLNVPEPGFHTISFSMREDGFELDKWVMAKDRDFKPRHFGPPDYFAIGVDTTQPPAPVNFKANLLNEHKVCLTWQEPDFGDTPLIEYDIFRDGQHYATLPITDTTYVDSFLVHNSQYTFTISATSIWSVDGELTLPINVTTGNDTTRPELVFAGMRDSTGIILQFNEPMDSVSLRNPLNYHMDDGIVINDIDVWPGFYTVKLNTSSHVKGRNYQIGFGEITDMAGMMPAGALVFYRLPEPAVFDYFDLEIINSYKYIAYHGAISTFIAMFGDSNSAAVCELNVPFQSEWYLWARVFALGYPGDPNAWTVQLNDDIVGTLGNDDDSYNIWHWAGADKYINNSAMPLPLGELEPGKYSIAFSAAEPAGNPGSNSIYLDMIYISNSAADFPDDEKALQISTGVEDSEPKSLIPAAFEVAAYPNPFNPAVKIRLTGATGSMDVRIYNVTGQEVASFQQVSTQHLEWSPRNLSSGIYIIKAISGSNVRFHKVMYMK